MQECMYAIGPEIYETGNLRNQKCILCKMYLVLYICQKIARLSRVFDGTRACLWAGNASSRLLSCLMVWKIKHWRRITITHACIILLYLSCFTCSSLDFEICWPLAARSGAMWCLYVLAQLWWLHQRLRLLKANARWKLMQTNNNCEAVQLREY